MSIAMFGGLHIYLAALKTAENRRESSGWTGELVQSGVATSGIADSFLKDHTSPQQDEPTRLQLVSCTSTIEKYTPSSVTKNM